jgi:hypothetical protein
MASATYPFAARAAGYTPSPKTNRLTSALESAHPVPWVALVTTRSPSIQCSSPEPVRRKSSGGSRWPPVAKTCNPAKPSCKTRAASGRSSRWFTGTPLSRASSSRFGVTQSTRGSKRSQSSLNPFGSSSSLPELERRTGSSTTGIRLPWPRNCSRKWTTAATTAAVPSIPIFIPAGGRSVQRYSRVARTVSAATGCVSNTPAVD